MAQKAQEEYELQLYNAKICPFGQRAWLTILQKGIDEQLGPQKFNIEWVDLKNKPEWFTKDYQNALGHDPKSDGKAPTIKHNGQLLTESSVVAAYLDRAYNDETKYGKPLIPTNARDAARVDLMNDVIGPLVMKPFFGLMLNADPAAAKEKFDALKQNLVVLNDKLARESEKKDGFLLDNVSLFEILCFPFFYRFQACENISNQPVTKLITPGTEESKGLERLVEWYEAVNKLESVKHMREKVDDKFLTEAYTAMRDGIIAKMQAAAAAKK